MNTERSTARNAAAMIVSQAITWTATFLLIIHLPRALGPAVYGKLNFSLAFMAMFAIFIDFGTTTLVTREVARDRSRGEAYLTNVLVMKAVAAAIAYVGLLWTAQLLHRPADVIQLMYIFGAGMVVNTVGRLVDATLQAFEMVHYLAWGEVMDKILGTAVILGLLFRGYGLLPIACGMAGMSLVHLFRNGYWVLRLVRPRLHLLSLRFMGQAMAASLPFFLFAVFAKVYDKVDVTMLSTMTNDTVVGYYGAAYRLFNSLFFLPHIFYTVTFPVLSRLSAGSEESYRQAVRRGFGLLAASAVGMSVATFFLAEPVVDLLYTQARFPGTAPALRVLAIALFFQYLNTMAVMVLQTTDRQAKWARAGAVAAVVNPAVNYLLIPRFGHLGAAATTAITEGMLLALAVGACPPGVLGRVELRALARSLAAGALLACALMIGLRWGAVPAMLLGTPLYAMAVIRFGVVSRSDIGLVAGTLLSMLRHRPKKPGPAG